MAELDWYEKVVVDGITVTAVPAIHGSASGLFDSNEVLWAGFDFLQDQKQIYFAGDTAYGQVFSEINKSIGPVEYALVPIVVYEPRQRMTVVHVNPDEAFKIGNDLHAKTIIGMHWGTIRLSEEAFEEPPRRFKQVTAQNGYTEETAWILKIGESRLLN